MTPSPVESELDKQPQAPLRFTYPSGSKPLEGYTIKRGVGRGGFGEVYFAVSDAGKEVALKLIRRNLDVELRGVTQCLNLKHHNLVALYDIRSDEHDDRWVVMEYVSGESLDEAIDRHPNGMPIEEAMHWFRGIAEGVAYLHDHGIVHRDLKPANIFIDEATVKIGDYGLSKFISCSRRSGQTESVGTVHYMAPEIANGRYGKEIDTYALGIILYEMLTGHVPFEGESVGEVLMKHLTAEPDLEVLEEPYKELVRGAMTKDPDTRIKSVAEMLQQLPGQEYRVVRPVAGATSSGVAAIEGATQAVSATNDEEPILAAVRGLWRSVVDEFRNSNLHPLAKAFLSISVLGFLFLSGVGEFIVLLAFPVTMVLGFSYLVYRVIRSIVIQPGQSTSVPMAASMQANMQPNQAEATALQKPGSPLLRQTKRQYARRRRQSWQQQLNRHVLEKPIRHRATEMLGSMIVAAVIAGLLAIIGCSLVSSQMTLEMYLWMAIVGTVGSWAVMVPTKLAEGHIEDQAPLRFGLLITGAMVGVVASVAADAFMLEVPVSEQMSIGPWDTLAGEFLDVKNETLNVAFRTGAVPLSLPTTTAFFAFLFVVLRWWRQAEYGRPDRVSVWSIVACTSVAYMMTFVWWFPQPLGAVVAAMVALTTQLSSPWMPPSRRRELAEEGV